MPDQPVTPSGGIALPSGVTPDDWMWSRTRPARGVIAHRIIGRPKTPCGEDTRLPDNTPTGSLLRAEIAQESGMQWCCVCYSAASPGPHILPRRRRTA